jgi:predicted DNA-binding transcriptional regulator AlpA
MAIDDDFLDAERLKLLEVARKVGVNTSTIWRSIKPGVKGQKLPAIRIGGRV